MAQSALASKKSFVDTLEGITDSFLEHPLIKATIEKLGFDDETARAYARMTAEMHLNLLEKEGDVKHIFEEGSVKYWLTDYGKRKLVPPEGEGGYMRTFGRHSKEELVKRATEFMHDIGGELALGTITFFTNYPTGTLKEIEEYLRPIGYTSGVECQSTSLRAALNNLLKSRLIQYVTQGCSMLDIEQFLATKYQKHED